MTTVGQRFHSEAWNFIWRVPFCGLAAGVGGIFYAQHTKRPIEPVAKAFAIAAATAAVFQCLINVVTDDSREKTILEVGVFSVLTVASLDKLRKMGLMSNRLALGIITVFVAASFATLKDHKVINI